MVKHECAFPDPNDPTVKKFVCVGCAKVYVSVSTTATVGCALEFTGQYKFWLEADETLQRDLRTFTFGELEFRFQPAGYAYIVDAVTGVQFGGITNHDGTWYFTLNPEQKKMREENLLALGRVISRLNDRDYEGVYNAVL